MSHLIIRTLVGVRTLASNCSRDRKHLYVFKPMALLTWLQRPKYIVDVDEFLTVVMRPNNCKIHSCHSVRVNYKLTRL